MRGIDKSVGNQERLVELVVLEIKSLVKSADVGSSGGVSFISGTSKS